MTRAKKSTTTPNPAGRTAKAEAKKKVAAPVKVAAEDAAAENTEQKGTETAVAENVETETEKAQTAKSKDAVAPAAGKKTNTRKRSGADSNTNESNEPKKANAKNKKAKITAPVAEKEEEKPAKVLENPLGTCRVFIGHLPFRNFEDKDLSELASKHGELKNVQMIIRPRKTARGFKNLFSGCAHVEYATPEQAAIAVSELNGMQYREFKLNADFARPPKHAFDEAPREPKSNPSTELFIGNLPFDMDNAEVESMFKNGGDGFLSLRRWAGKGHAFVSYDTVENATAALKMFNGHKIKDRHLRIDFDEPRSLTHG